MLWSEGREAGEGNPDISNEDVRERAEEVRESQTFKNVMANGNDVTLAHQKNLSELVGELSAEYQVLRQEREEVEKAKKQEEKKRRVYLNITKKRGQEVLEAATDLKSTLAGTNLSSGTGKYWGGIISRKKNSDEYESMLQTIGKFDQEPNSNTLKETVDAVMKYLDGKETPRKSGTGQVRWRKCMEFLATAMPRDEFDKYCQKINAIRKAKPGSEHYVSSEMFLADGANVRSNINAVNRRIATKDVTKRDFARIIAMHELFDEPVEPNGQYEDMEEFMELRLGQEQLAWKTTEVMKREDFKELMKKPGQELVGLLDKNGCMKLKNYRELLPKHPEIEQAKKAQPEKDQSAKDRHEKGKTTGKSEIVTDKNKGLSKV